MAKVNTYPTVTPVDADKMLVSSDASDTGVDANGATKQVLVSGLATHLAARSETLTNKTIGAATLDGTLNGGGQAVQHFLNGVVTGVSGTLTTTAHSGNVLVTSGSVTVPTTAGFTCILIAGGAHTVTFNATTSAAMATGDLMTVVVESGTVIHAVLTASADKVVFS